VDAPRISVVTPSFEQAQYLEAAIVSVLSQNYSDLEYLILDGGSSDGSREIIERYKARLAFWRSAKDAGQAAAINEGFRRATGEILGWLNSDDLYTRTALTSVAQTLGPYLGEPCVCYGACEIFRDDRAGKIRTALEFNAKLLQTTDPLDQPSVFWTRKAWELVGPLDEKLHYAFDWDWFLRATQRCRFVRMDTTLSRYRIHAAHKSGTGGDRRWKELIEVVRRHSSPEIVAHYEFLDQHKLAHWWLNKRMRLKQTIARIFPGGSDYVADLLSPPFWWLPRNIDRRVLWQISGIR
jgi:glycosyltransferase involved in cell wall biosynthesis